VQPQQEDGSTVHEARDALLRYPLLDAILYRRSRRFSQGMNLAAAPLAYRSASEPLSLGEEEEAALAFAACGVTGHALAELPYASGSDASGRR